MLIPLREFCISRILEMANLPSTFGIRKMDSAEKCASRYFGSGIPSWRQILRARKSAISYVWELSYSAGIGEIYVFAMLRAFVGENASEPLQMSNELSPLQSNLNLFDHDLVFGQLR